MIEPAAFDPKRTPALHWDGKDWPVPPLVADQLDVVWDPIVELTKVLFAQDKDRPPEEPMPESEASGVGSDTKALIRGFEIVQRRYDLTSEQYAKMREVVFYGLLRAHPKLAVKEFRSVPTTSLEIFTAFLVVRRQSGIYGDFEGANPPQGEAQAAESPNPTSNIS